VGTSYLSQVRENSIPQQTVMNRFEMMAGNCNWHHLVAPTQLIQKAIIELEAPDQ